STSRSSASCTPPLHDALPISLLAWGIPLALAAAVLIAGLVPVYFLFPPAWVLSTVLYVLFARLMGAAEDYPDGVAADKVFAERRSEEHTSELQSRFDLVFRLL